MSVDRSRPTIRVQTDVDDETAKKFYALYRETFGELETRAVARQVFHEHEFLEEMHDPRIRKHVAWDSQGEAVGMCTLTAHLETIPWISPAYFAHHYPEHTARGAVYYLGFALVTQERRRSRLFHDLIGSVVDLMVERQAVCAWDVCGYNNDVLRLGGNIEALLHRLADVTVVPTDTQTYYSGTFRGRPTGR